MVGALVAQEQGAVDVALDGRPVGRQREEELVEAADVLPRLDGPVLAEVLREGQHQRLALVEHVDLLALALGELVALHDTEYGHHGAQAEEDEREEPYLPEARFDVFQRFEFHCLSFYRVYLFY